MSLNSNDLYRLEILTKVKEKRLKQSKAARFCNHSDTPSFVEGI